MPEASYATMRGRCSSRLYFNRLFEDLIAIYYTRATAQIGPVHCLPLLPAGDLRVTCNPRVPAICIAF